MWTIKRMHEWMESYLSDHGDENPKVSTFWLISDALGMSRTDLFLNYDMPLQAEQLDILRDYVHRRASGEPLQYITGKTFFRHIEVQVESGVLIPRPETEVLVSEVLAWLPQAKRVLDWNHGDVDKDRSNAAHSDAIRIAEIGCGSGCIACSLAYEHPEVEVWCTDISPLAVGLTQRNAELLEVSERVHPIQCDLGNALDGEFDAVVSNPPYIPTAVINTMPSEVIDYEPEAALHGGEDGLDIFRRILDWSYDSLKEGGLLACELHEESLQDAASLAREAGFHDVRIVNDLAERPRVLLAVR